MSETNKSEALVAYVPVLHAGYLELFHRHPEADMHVLDEDVLDQFPHLRKDIRALKPLEAGMIIDALTIFPTVRLLGSLAMDSLEYERIVMPDDEVSRQLNLQHFTDREVIFEPIFLRWDRNNSFVNIDVEPDRVIQAGQTDEAIIKAIYEEADKSSDWWRQVGAAIVCEEEILLMAHNHHLPSQHTPWIDGDPRNNARRGVALEAATVQHAEAALIAQAAKEGKSLKDTSLFVTTFPCPPCAKLIAESGIGKCYYTEGYAMADGLRVLKDFGVEVVRIETNAKPPSNPQSLKSYPEKS